MTIPYEGHGIFRKLEHEHAEVSSLIERAATSDDRALQAELYAEIHRQLLVHMKGEEQEFYALLRQLPETAELAVEARAQHAEIERALDLLDTLEPGSREWSPALEQLKSLVESHVRDEEARFFPRAKEVLEQGQLDATEQRYIAASARIEKRL